MKASCLSAIVGCCLAFGGCLSSAPKAPTCWMIDKGHSEFPPADVAQTLGDARIARVGVSAAYNVTRLAVLRGDGSVAYDAFNAFAVSPAALLEASAREAVRRYGRFRRTMSSTSTARTRYALEFDVTTLALDCRVADEPKALVEMTVTLLDGREIAGVAEASASVAARDDYSAAFSTAFFRAASDALSQL